jgi:hypothetical protein
MACLLFRKGMDMLGWKTIVWDAFRLRENLAVSSRNTSVTLPASVHSKLGFVGRILQRWVRLLGSGKGKIEYLLDVL